MATICGFFNGQASRARRWNSGCQAPNTRCYAPRAIKRRGAVLSRLALKSQTATVANIEGFAIDRLLKET